MLKLMNLIVMVFDFNKGVKVELAQKRPIIAMTEVLRQEYAAKLIGLVDSKCMVARCPTDEILVLWCVKNLC